MVSAETKIVPSPLSYNVKVEVKMMDQVKACANTNLILTF